LPKAMVDNAFICEPTGNLVHREVLEPAGATFHSSPGREGVEFLASRDEWFRPVNMTVGPDGALYVVDMYRAVIEHPDWMPDELRKRPDLRDGDDRGRIYRLVAAATKNLSQNDAGSLPRPGNVAARRDFGTGSKNLSQNDAGSLPRPGSNKDRRPVQRSQWTSQQLLTELASRNAWRRETALRLLVERQARDVTPQLRKMAIDSDLPATRVAALHLLANLDSLTPETVQQALHDQYPGVRQQAIVLAEAWLGNPKNPGTESGLVATAKALRTAILSLAGDPNPRVRFQVALSLTPAAERADIDALLAIALASPGDPWTRRAVILAAGRQVGPFLCSLLRATPWKGHALQEGETALFSELAAQTGAVADIPDQQSVLAAVAALTPDPPTARLQQIVLARLAHAMRRQGRSIASLLGTSDAEKVKPAIDAIFDAAEKLAADEGGDSELRCEAVRMLAHVPRASTLLATLARDEPSQKVRIGAMEALAEQTDLEPWRDLLAEYSSLTPVVRRALLDAILKRPDRIRLLLDAMAAEEIRGSEIDRVRRQRLLQYRDTAIRKRANELFEASIPADRTQVLADYREVLELAADPRRGREVFRKNCSTCHLIGGVGVRVGPDIGDTRVKTPEQLLTDVIQPNRAIDSNYIAYAVLTEDGRTLNGLLAAETASSITLTQEENKTVTLTKDQVEEIRSTGVSLMPEGLEKNIPKQEMADLVSFLKNWRYLDGKTPARGFETPPAADTRSTGAAP
ncbi:MAG: c-type cytochrome, partial [Pirellulales bacterium]